MSLQQTLEIIDGSQRQRDFKHEIFELCMLRVDRGEMTQADMQAEMVRLGAYFSDQGGRAAVRASAEVAVEAPQVTTALAERSA